MSLEAETYDIISKIIVTAVPTIIISGLLYSLIKTFITNLTDYIMLRWDSLGIGSRVMYKDYQAVIQEMSFRKITLLTDDKLILVPSSEWTKMSIIIPIKPADIEKITR